MVESSGRIPDLLKKKKSVLHCILVSPRSSNKLEQWHCSHMASMWSAGCVIPGPPRTQCPFGSSGPASQWSAGGGLGAGKRCSRMSPVPRGLRRQAVQVFGMEVRFGPWGPL